MKSKGMVLLLLGVCFVLTLPMAAQSDPASGQDHSSPAVAPQEGATFLQGATLPAPDLGLFAPKPENRTCYGECLKSEIPIYCSGLSGAELQSCANDIAEGCRCSCGLYCP